MPEKIQFIGLNSLSDHDKDKVEILSSKCLEKIQKKLPNISIVKVQVKPFEKNGKVSKYSALVKIITPKKSFEAKKIEWKLDKLMQISFDAIQKEIEHFVQHENTFMRKIDK